LASDLEVKFQLTMIQSMMYGFIAILKNKRLILKTIMDLS